MEEDQERRKGANAVATSTTFAPVIATISSGGAGGALVTWRQVVPPGPLAEAPREPQTSEWKKPDRPHPLFKLPGLCSNTWTILLSGPKKYLHFD